MTTCLDIGDVRLTRVLYADALIDPAAVGLTADEVRDVWWASPTWAEDGHVRAASCVWVISTAGRHIAIDPSGNIDETLHDPASTEAHQAAYAAAFAAAGIPIETIDTVLLSHIESIGLSAVSGAGGWRPFFPNARLLMSDRAHQSFVDHPPDGQLQEALRTLLDAGKIDTFSNGAEIAPGLSAEWTGMHDIGHCAFHVHAGTETTATFVGHLAATPLHLATGPCPSQNYEPDDAWRWLTAITSNPSQLIIGPLWPSPGAIRWHGDHPVAIEGSERDTP